MKRSVFKAALLFGGSCLLASAALTQDAPESLLPDIFGPSEPAPPREVQPAIPNDPGEATDDTDEPERQEDADETGEDAEPAQPSPAAERDDPLASERTYADFRLTGPLTPARGGYGSRVFAGSNGAMFAAWMNRIDTPLASRWAHIVLRRALLSRAPTPPNIRPADWVAARVLMLTRMGEADGAKLLLQGLPLDGYTPRLYAVASQAHLAAADVPALCPLAPTARAISNDNFWRLAVAICAGLDGDDETAVTLFNRLRREDAVSPLDLLLAERLTGLAGGADRAANVDWDQTERLNAYSFGMATAGGVEIPEDLWDAASPAVHGWAFRAGDAPLEQRAASAKIAAATGIVSARELGALASLRADRAGADEVPQDAVRLRAAYAGRTPQERLSAIEDLVEEGDDAGERYAALLLVAPAAATLEPSADLAESAPMLIEAMLAAGRTRAALSWWPVLVNASEDVRMRAWPMLVLADQTGNVPLSPGLARAAYKIMAADTSESAAAGRMSWLIGGLAGLGRIGGNQWDSFFEDFPVGRRSDVHTRALALAGQRGRKGEVAVLAALGLQAPWDKVRPRDIAPILSAFDGAGLGVEARLLAVEAFTRTG